MEISRRKQQKGISDTIPVKETIWIFSCLAIALPASPLPQMIERTPARKKEEMSNVIGCGSRVTLCAYTPLGNECFLKTCCITRYIAMEINGVNSEGFHKLRSEKQAVEIHMIVLITKTCECYCIEECARWIEMDNG